MYKPNSKVMSVHCTESYNVYRNALSFT